MENDDSSDLTEENNESDYQEFLAPNIFSLPLLERPRERLAKFGSEALSDQELLAIVLNTGTKGKSVSLLSREILRMLDHAKTIPSIDDLGTLSGLGFARACMVVAMLQFGKRFWDFSGTKVKAPQDVFNLVHHYANRKQENFITVSLNGAHKVIMVRIVTIGLINRTMVHPRELFSDPLSDRCSAICVCHNHPSGDVEPSKEDDAVTANLESVAALLGIRFLDHIVFSETSFYSYRSERKLKELENTGWFCAMDRNEELTRQDNLYII